MCVFCVLSNEHVKAKNVRNTLPPGREKEKKIQHFTKQTTETHPTIKPPGGREGFVLDLEQETCLACADRCLNCTSSGPSRCDAHGCNKACDFLKLQVTTATLKKKDGTCMANVSIFPKE